MQIALIRSRSVSNTNGFSSFLTWIRQCKCAGALVQSSWFTAVSLACLKALPHPRDQPQNPRDISARVCVSLSRSLSVSANSC